MASTSRSTARTAPSRRAVRVKPRELLSGQQRDLHGRGHRLPGRRPQVQRRRRVALQVDAAGQVVAGLGRAVVRLQQRFIQRHQHGLRSQRGQVQNLHVQLRSCLRLASASCPCTRICTGIICARAPRMPRMAASRSSLKAPIGRAGIDNLEGVQRRSQRGDHLGRGHGQRNRPGLQE